MAVDDFISYSCLSNTGVRKKTNEDFILVNADGFGGEMLLCCVADGAGAEKSLFRPASIAATQVEKSLVRAYRKDPDLLRENLRFFMEESFQTANDVVAAFKLGDEETRFGFATTLTAAMIEQDGTLTCGHVGNTRLYLLRDGVSYQITKDHTEAQRLVDENILPEESYYTSEKRLVLTNGIGVVPVPEVETVKLPLQKNDVVIMTSDGIHYSYSSDAFFEIMMETETIDDAAKTMIQAALDLANFPDNISVCIMWYHGVE